MLALTQSAADAVEAMITQTDVPDSAVVRISSQEAEDASGAPATELQVTLAEQPEEGDVLIEGIALSIEPQTLAFLDDKVIDAEIEDGGVRFALFLQPPQAASANGGDPLHADDADDGASDPPATLS